MKICVRSNWGCGLAGRVIPALIVVLLGAMLILVGCVSKTDYPTDLPTAGQAGKPSDTTYVVVNPVWTMAGGREFKHPMGVTFGYDRSVYICDSGNDRVVRFGITGEFLAEYPVPNPVQVTQDRQLNLLCIDGEGSWFRREHFGDGDFELVRTLDSVWIRTILNAKCPDSVEVDSVWVYFERNCKDTIYTRAPTRFAGIAASPLIDRYYLLADSTRNEVSLINVEDKTLIRNIFESYQLNPISDLVGMTTYPTGENSYNIVLTLGGDYNNIRIVRGSDFRDVVLDTADIYEMLPPGPKRVTRDDDGNFLVVGPNITNFRYTHYIYRFTRHGAFDLKFGEPGIEPGYLNWPHDIAYGEGIVYIADTFNSRIVRYRLSTDLQF